MRALPDAVSTELTRLVRRWQQLPLDQAGALWVPVRAVIEGYAALLHPAIPVPDLGPAVLLDQLTVVVYDALLAAKVDPAAAAADLARLRRSLDP
ncbi:MAG: hypothetical protein IPH03_17425 [Tetrasphaera sp.]|nr:hypothetical protein [Tetrasphaera sp.]